MNIEESNHHFGIEEHVSFKNGNGGLPIAFVNNSFASASISLYGAHVLSYAPHHETDILWISPQSAFETGKPIRGGIPVCFPWFGPHPSNSQLPVHGFARLQLWSVAETSITPEKSTKIKLTLQDNAETRAIWPYGFKLELEVTVGAQLEVNFILHNTGNEPFTTTNSLHTYFNVKNLKSCTITGLTKLPYYDPAGMSTGFYQQEEALIVSQEENRRYYTHEGECVLHDPELGRNIHIHKTGSKVTVIWNPWQETVKNIGDIADEAYLNFVCIEQANAYEDTTELAPGTRHVLGLRVYL